MIGKEIFSLSHIYSTSFPGPFHDISIRVIKFIKTVCDLVENQDYNLTLMNGKNKRIH